MSTDLPTTLRIFNWSEYTSPKVLKDFERKFGVKCDLKLYDSNEQLTAQLKRRPDAYDIVVPEDAFVSVLASAGQLRPLDMSLIPNFAKYVTDEAFRSPPFDPGTGGKKYSVPYMFGSIGVGVRLDKVPDPGESWSIMYDPRFKGRMSMLDGSREVLGPALFSLGYSLNTTSQGELDEATAKAIAQKPLVTTYSGSGMAPRMVGGLPLVECWDGDVVTAMNKLGISKLRYLLPKEGYNVWMDGICIPASSPNPYAAHLFLNFILDPVNAAASASYIGYQPVVAAADPLLTSLVQRAMRPTAEVIAKGTFVKDLGSFNKAFDTAWVKVQKA
jgi:spermidine/putrescine transport system substrate-binding protein